MPNSIFILSSSRKVQKVQKYYFNYYPEKYLNLKNSSRANFWVCIGQFGVGELESTVNFLIACLQSAIGRFFKIESQENLPIDFEEIQN